MGQAMSCSTGRQGFSVFGTLMGLHPLLVSWKSQEESIVSRTAQVHMNLTR